MTQIEYRTTIAALGLSQVKAAAFLCVSPRQSRRWALGEAPIPAVVSKLLCLMIDLNINPKDVL